MELRCQICEAEIFARPMGRKPSFCKKCQTAKNTKRQREQRQLGFRKEKPESNRARVLRWQVENKDKVNSKNKQWYHKNPDKVRLKSRKKQGMLNPPAEAKSGRCEICGKHKDMLNLDHDHSTGIIRGWLCRTCNLGLGAFKDSVIFMINATNYLKKHKV